MSLPPAPSPTTALDGRLPLLAQLRTTWPNDPYPLVVRREANGLPTLCPAPSLWMGARAIAHALRDRGAGPGDRVVYRGPIGAEWIQTLIAALRIGAGFDADAAARDGFVVDPDRSVARLGRSHAVPRGARLRHHGQWRWSWADDWHRVDASFRRGEIVTPAASWSMRTTFFDDLLPALLSGAELHCATARRDHPENGADDVP